MATSLRPIGDHLREWRQRRRMSQLDLALEADISTRHLSFLETGRSQPSRDMILNLAERLDVPLRERNLLLVEAGFAPAFQERPIGDPALRVARAAVDLVLKGHEPYPAIAIDRHWTLVAHNAVVPILFAGIAATLLAAPVNVLRLSLHPDGLAPRIVNLLQWRAHLFARLRRQIDVTADAALVELLNELQTYPAPREPKLARRPVEEFDGVVVPLQLSLGEGMLNLVSTTTIFGTPVDITLSELALESFFPADDATANALRRIAGSAR